MHTSSNEELLFALVVVISVVCFILLLLFVVLYNFISTRKRRSSDILKAVFQSQEIQRDKIAMELHDELGSKISIIKFTNEFILSENQSPKGRDFAVRNSELIDELARLTRYISRDYSSKLIITNGLKNELNRLMDDCRQLHTIKFELLYEIDSIYLTDDFTINIYRVIQELCNNSLKHSNCNHIRIQLKHRNEDLFVIYSDDGSGAIPNKVSEGMGMRNIAGRVIAHKGHLDVTSTHPGLKYIISFKLINVQKFNESIGS